MVLGQPKMAGAMDARDTLFRPAGTPMFLGFQVYDMACLDCGYIGTCLSEDERSGLERKLQQR